MGRSKRQLHYRPDIDGLRAVAVIPVVLYHAGVQFFSGGYVGVDVFFVISGFLIAGIIAREIQSDRFSLVNFYERRARRILPALFVVIGATLAAGWVIAWPDNYVEIGESALATVFFSSNFYFWQTTDYFATAAEYRPLLHTWSLAVEEQFYIFFPLLLILMAKLPRSRLLASLVAIFVISVTMSVAWTVTAPGAAFYLAPVRAWELLVGVFLALSIFQSWSSSLLRETASIAGLALIFGSVVAFDSTTPFPGLAAMAPCIGTALIIQSGRGGGPPTLVFRILSKKGLVFFGLISYSLYLWHWPILAFSRQWLGTTHLPGAWSLACIITSVILAAISWQFVERPFRSKTTFSREGVFLFSGVGAVVLVCLGVPVLAAGGMPHRFSPPVLDALAGAQDMEEDRRGCMGPRSAGDFCVIGAKDADASAMLLGDSHAAALMSAVSHVLEVRGKSGYLASQRACPPLLGVHRIGSGSSEECVRFIDSTLEFIATNRDALQTVFLVARWPLNARGQRAPGEDGGDVRLALNSGGDDLENAQIVEQGLNALVRRITDMGIHVIILGGVPEIGWEVPNTVALVTQRGGELPRPPTIDDISAQHASADKILRTVSQSNSLVSYVPIAEMLCTPMCQVLDGSKPLYVDDDHLSKYGASEILGPKLDEKFDRKLALVVAK